MTCCRALGRMLSPLARSSKGTLDALKEFCGLERFRQKIDCAGFHRLGAHSDISMPSDKNELLIATTLNQSFLKLNAVQTWHSHIDHHAAGPGVGRPGQEFVRRLERFAFEIGR